MRDELKIKLDNLRKEQKEKHKKKDIEKERNNLKTEIPDFDKRFRFASEEEAAKLETFITQLPISYAGIIINYSLLNSVQAFDSPTELNKFDDNIFWICCMYGSEELLKIYVQGTMRDFVKNYKEWDFISPSFLLISENMVDFFYIDDNGKVISAKI